MGGGGYTDGKWSVPDVISDEVGQSACITHPPIRQLRVPAYFPLYVELAFSVSGEEDAPGFKVQIHQVEGNAALEVTIDTIQNDLTPDIDYLEIREVRFGNCLVNGLVLLYAAKEIKLGHFRRSVRVIRVPRANFERNVRGDNSWVIAHRFDEYRDYSPFTSYPRFNGSSVHGITCQKSTPS